MRDCWFRIEDGGSGEDGGEGAQDEGEVAEQGAPRKIGQVKGQFDGQDAGAVVGCQAGARRCRAL